jgi:hypothetical protein
MPTNHKKNIQSIALCLLAIGTMMSIAGCLSQETEVPIEQNMTSNPPLLSPEKICYDINPSVNTTEQYPVGYPPPIDKVWIHIDPIADHKAGDVFHITGCTNVPEGTQLSGYITQAEYFTPRGAFPIPSTEKNISLMSGYNDSIHYFSYDVNSADAGFKKYSIYECTIMSNPAINFRRFNITH